MNDIIEVKNKLKFLIKESFNKCKSNNFRDLNFIFIDKTPEMLLKSKLLIIDNLDEYSKTFLSIHTRAKIAKREFLNNKFDSNYLELMRLVFTLPESLNSNTLKSKVLEKEFKEITKINNKLIEDFNVNKDIKKNTIHLKENINGKKINDNNNKLANIKKDMADLDF